MQTCSFLPFFGQVLEESWNDCDLSCGAFPWGGFGAGMEQCSAEMSLVLVSQNLKALIVVYPHCYQEVSIQKLFINVKKKK